MKFVLIFLFTLVPTLVFSQEPTSSQPILAANSYSLFDYTSGQFLVEQNANAHVPPVQLTKLMTAYVVFDAIKQGKLSVGSPIARALIAKEEGDVVTVKTPGGVIEYEIVEVSHL